MGPALYRSQAYEAWTSSFFSNGSPTTEIYTLSLHDALPISAVRLAARGGRRPPPRSGGRVRARPSPPRRRPRSEEHTSELQSPDHLVCRLLLQKKKSQRASPCRDGARPPSTPLSLRGRRRLY